MSRLIFLDQNAWIVLARGAWDKCKYPNEHAALTKIVEGVKAGLIRAVFDRFESSGDSRRA